jgi:DNA polymerase I-like protein with 3'-5' exonuclease and polymerase domains/5'-3' exonuclease
MSRLVLIDANSLIHRAFHAIPPLTTTKGELVNAVYGFASTLLKVFAELKPDYVVACFDTPEPTFRHEAFAEYKATRVEMDKALSPQFAYTQEILRAFNIPFYGIAGFEADDLIGTLAELAISKPPTDYGQVRLGYGKRKKAIDRSQSAVSEVIIVSGDRDSLQLVTDKVKVYMPGRTMADTLLYDILRVENRFGLEPHQLIDFKALAGDPSDNVPGVAGIGEVTATKLIQEFGSLENLYKNLEKVPEKIRAKLEAQTDQAFLSKKLVTVLKNIPVKLNLEAARLKDYNRAKVIELFQNLEFKSLLPRLPESTQKKPAPTVLPIPKMSGELSDLDQKLLPILKKMQTVGVLVDKKVLDEASQKINSKLSELERRIFSQISHQCNLNSPKQLAQVLYEELKLPPVKKIKTGLSTDEQTLRTLSGTHPVIDLILEYRELFKLKSTYIDVLPKFIDPKDGRIHSTFRLDVTVTGRLSSQNPNLQNIPVRGVWGKVMRAAIVAPPRCFLLSADYSQIELRVMAHIACDPGLIEAFEKGEDIHAATAAKILGKPIGKITADDRRLAKSINFGLMYGMSTHGVAQQLGIDHSQAAKLIEEYFVQFPRVATYIQETIREAQEQGYVETLSGRRRYIPELTASNARIRAAGERMAINAPIQGSAAEIIKKAMIDIEKEFKIQNSKCKMILQIHDELLFEVPEDELKVVAPMIKEKMEKAFSLSVPIVVDLKVGKNWGEMRSFNKYQ